MFSNFIVVLITLFATVAAANEAPVLLDMKSLHQKNVESMQQALKGQFKPVLEELTDAAALRGPALEVESMSGNTKYLNMFAYSDGSCSDLTWSMYLPLDSCLPNFWGLTNGNFVKWSCDESALECSVVGYKQAGCKTKASGTHRASASIVEDCTENLYGFTAAYYGFSSTQPYHTSGMMTKIYREDDCSGPHLSFYTPDHTCNNNDDSGSSYEYICSDGAVQYWPSSTDCDGYSEYIPVQTKESDYDICTDFTAEFDSFDATGGSLRMICGGIVV
jgi:hypothetical protein